MNIILAESTADVVFSSFAFWICEDALRVIHLDQFTLEKERRLVTASGCLLHVMRNNHNGVLISQFIHEFLDGQRAAWIQSAARFIH